MGVLASVIISAIDKVDITSDLYFVSLLTVYTQMGFLIISFFMARIFTMDVVNKSTYFYRVYSNSGFSVLFNKYLINIIWFVISTLIVCFIAGIYYSDIALSMITFINIVFVIMFQVSVISIIAIIFGRIVPTIAFILFYWIGSVVLRVSNEVFAFLNPFDQSGNLSKAIVGNIQSRDLIITKEMLLYGFGYFTLTIIIIYLFNKVWIKKGI